MSTGNLYQAVVIGAGINGLSTAYQLLKRGLTKVALIEQFSLGHSKGSSQGLSRITRSTYSSSKFVEIIQTAHQEDWPALERDLDQQLLHPRPGCFFGPGIQQYRDSLEAVPEVLPYIDLMSPEEGRLAFPHFVFGDSPFVIRDRTCSLIAAQATNQRLLRYFVEHGGEFRSQEAVLSIDLQSPSQPIEVRTSQGQLQTERLVITAGPWTHKLLPLTTPVLRPAHQDVGYFGFGPEAPAFDLEHFPVWIYAGEGGLAGDDTFYGLPEFGRPGVKVARHRTGSHTDEPDRDVSETMPEQALADLREFNRRQFAFPMEPVGYEPCMYTNTSNEDFLLDLHPNDPRVVIGAGFSGHGFKFGPLTGRILAELLLDGRTQVASFERHRQDFSFKQMPAW
jgi:monomeric sarcosine oxidase